MKINSRHYILILWALVTIMISIYGYYFIYAQTIARAEHYIRANTELANENIKKQSEQELLNIYESTKADRARVNAIILNKDKAVSFIEMIERIGVDSKTELEILSIVNDEKNLKANIEVKGSWGGVMIALSLLENLPFGVSLKNTKLFVTESLEKEARKWNLNINIEALLINSK